MGKIAEVFLGKIPSSSEGKYAFRGQANAEWELHSSATRRLRRAGRIQTNGSKQTSNGKLWNIYRGYHKEDLIFPARTAGFDIEEGRVVSDLQLLSKLQHFGAATGLIDFTWNPLIALWFACAEHREKGKKGKKGKERDGKVFVVNLNDTNIYTNIYKRVSSEKGTMEEQETIEKLFPPPYDGSSLRLYWEPKVRSEAGARILVQQSVFVLAHPHVLQEVEGEITKKISIDSSDKKAIRQELADLGITQLSLFRDIHGFSVVNDQYASGVTNE